MIRVPRNSAQGNGVHSFIRDKFLGGKDQAHTTCQITIGLHQNQPSHGESMKTTSHENELIQLT